MWTIEEIDILRSNYPLGGYASCAPLLPFKSRGAINSKAMRLGIKLSDSVKLIIAENVASKNLVHDLGCKNNNWKDGVSKDFYRYKKIQKQRCPVKAGSLEQRRTLPSWQ